MQTASNISTDGTLTVTGAATLSSTLAVTGASTLTGAVAASSTLAVTGASTLTGAVTCGSYFGVGTAAQLGGVDDYATTYSWLYCDGTDVVSPGIKLYDTTTGAFRRCYLDNGSLAVV